MIINEKYKIEQYLSIDNGAATRFKFAFGAEIWEMMESAFDDKSEADKILFQEGAIFEFLYHDISMDYRNRLRTCLAEILIDNAVKKYRKKKSMEVN